MAGIYLLPGDSGPGVCDSVIVVPVKPLKLLFKISNHYNSHERTMMYKRDTPRCHSLITPLSQSKIPTDSDSCTSGLPAPSLSPTEAQTTLEYTNII
eukprot:1386582-Amorphochlora_amoeboformis.AAC.1